MARRARLPYLAMHALLAFGFLWPQINVQPGGGAKRLPEFQARHPVNQEKIQARAGAASYALACEKICAIKAHVF